MTTTTGAPMGCRSCQPPAEVVADLKRVSAPVGALRGGNQQKVAIARALATGPWSQ